MSYITFQPKDYFNTKLYTQSGSSNNGATQTLTMDNVGWVWIKNRDYTNGHCLFDIVRGGDKNLASNVTAAQETIGGGLTFGASDTTIGADTGGYGFNNRVGDKYVAWHWRTDGTSGSANSDGSTSSTVSVNTTAGFSIVKWTGSGSATTIGHGLGVTPKIIMLKNTSEVYGWQVYHASLGNTKYLALDSTDAQATSSQSWNNTSPTSTVFSVGASDSNNKSGNTIIAYCFAEKKGFSKFGSYTGNSNANGVFIYTGFKPGWIMVKRYDSGTEDWNMWDSKRIGYNISGNDKLYANLNSAELTSEDAIDILSNGFKWRTTNGGLNNSSGTYIYMAFAEHPLVSSNEIPATAR